MSPQELTTSNWELSACSQFGASQVTAVATMRVLCVHKVFLLLVEGIGWMMFLSCSRLILGCCFSFYSGFFACSKIIHSIVYEE